VERDETVSLAFLMLMERLTPVERAVFLLREVFQYEYAEVADLVDRTEANCRQLFARARRHLDAARPRFEVDQRRGAELTESFLTAIDAGDVAALERMLADDVVLYGDGGGKAPAITQPLHGATQVARFLIGLQRLSARIGVHLEPRSVNAAPGALAVDASGSCVGVLTVDVYDGRVLTVRSLINPDKLGHLGDVGDLTALLGARPDSR
jgi:RNA polymerase sigma-70 factor (ECF subfamily)